MQKRGFLLRYATLALLAVLVARVYCAAALPRPQEYSARPDRAAFLHFGQSFALADFDGDDRVDKAIIAGAGFNKSIEIRLSRTKAHTFLHFDTLTSDPGSVFARDVDNDGDNDLIWSDLLHPDDVVIWLDDGGGRFERICPDRYAEEFVISDASVLGSSEIPQQDLAFSPRHERSSALLPAHKVGSSQPTPTFIGEWRQVPVAAGILKTALARGPPSVR